MCLFTVAVRCSFVTSGNIFLEDMYLHYIAVAAHVNFVFMLFLPANVFKLVVMTDQFIFN